LLELTVGKRRLALTTHSEVTAAVMHQQLYAAIIALGVFTVSGSQFMGRGLLLWLLGIPIPVIILLYLFHVV
jgi:hypothetical protein